MAAGTNEGIDMEYSFHGTPPMTVIQTGFVCSGIIQPVEIALLESLGNRIGVKPMGRVEAKIANHNEMRFLNMLGKTKKEVDGRK